MNIINLDKHGEVVDPEDWSPQRTQYLEPVAPGQSATLHWRVNAILDGDFMVYIVAIPAPGSPEATSQPVASSGIHLTVTPYTKLNPGGVLPYAIEANLGGCAIFLCTGAAPGIDTAVRNEHTGLTVMRGEKRILFSLVGVWKPEAHNLELGMQFSRVIGFFI
jgi:hypothetical protein